MQSYLPYYSTGRMDPLKFGTVGGGGGDRQEFLEMGDKHDMSEWIWNCGD